MWPWGLSGDAYFECTLSACAAAEGKGVHGEILDGLILMLEWGAWWYPRLGMVKPTTQTLELDVKKWRDSMLMLAFNPFYLSFSLYCFLVLDISEWMMNTGVMLGRERIT